MRFTRVLRWMACGCSLNLVSGTGGSPIDATVQALAKLRDEGFRRVWMSQMPYDADLLTVLAVALREVDTIEVVPAVSYRSRTSTRCRWPSVR